MPCSGEEAVVPCNAEKTSRSTIMEPKHARSCDSLVYKPTFKEEVADAAQTIRDAWLLRAKPEHAHAKKQGYSTVGYLSFGPIGKMRFL